MKNSRRLLIIDDEENMRHMLGVLLAKEGYRVDTAGDGREALGMVEEKEYDCILCDVKMPKMDGLAFLRAAKPYTGSATVIMMSAYGTIDTAVEAMRNGAYDFISKPFKPDEVVITLKKAFEEKRLRVENRQLKEQVEKLEEYRSFGKLIAGSKAMCSPMQLAGKVAQYDSTVLVTGESGTGKELVARGIHDKSPRADGPFVAINCGSVPEALLESEFFGYVKGAFTGADRNKKGLFEEAGGGTLFLDEIGDLPAAMQVKLLRVLQEGEVMPVGAGKPKKIDVRVIAATGKNLEKEVEEKRFRGDLFYRLNVVHIPLPPLRERPEDISLLCDHFVRKINRKTGTKIKGISPAARQLLLKHSWPGNVRELENVMERAMILAEKEIILPENLPGNLGGKGGNRRLDDIFGGFSLKKAQKIMEQRLISRAMEATGGNKSKAAELLELSYPSLLSKIKEYKI